MSEGHKFNDAASALAFVRAGRAVFTIKSLVSGKHITFKARVKKSDNPVRPPVTFVSVRTGGAGKNQWGYLGILTEHNTLRQTHKSVYADGAVEARALGFALANLRSGRLPPQAELWHEGKCGRCSRALSDPESVARGFGPECIGKIMCEAA